MALTHKTVCSPVKGISSTQGKYAAQWKCKPMFLRPKGEGINTVELQTKWCQLRL